MHLWGYKSHSECCLCGNSKCTLHHILSGCTFSLEQKRFTWRHDSILSLINKCLQAHIQTRNQLQQNVIQPALIQFVKSGQQSIKGKKQSKADLLSIANDWHILVDLPGSNFIFPPEIFATAERPDIVIWFPQAKRVIDSY